MTPETFCEQFATFAEAPNGVAKLRELILQLAVQGKLGTQDVNDEPASESQRKDRGREGEAPAEPRTAKRRQSSIAARQEPRPPDANDFEDVPFTIPSGWSWRLVSDVFDVSGGITKNPKRTPVKNHYPYLRVANVQRGRLKLEEMERFELCDGELERWRLQPGDVLVVEGNGSEDEIGRCALWNGEIEDCVHQNHIIRCRPLTDDVQNFVLLFLNSPAGIAEMKARAITTSGLYSLSVGKIRSLVIPLPPLAEQRRIVGKVDQLLGLCDELAARQAARREARSALVGATLDRLVSATDRSSRHPACRGGSTAFALLGRVTGSSSAKAVEPPGQARWRLMQEHAHRLRDHFDRLFDTPTTLPQLRQAILQLAVQGQLVPQDPNDEPADSLRQKLKKSRRKYWEEMEVAKMEVKGVKPKDDDWKQRLTDVAPFHADDAPTLPANWKWVRVAEVGDVQLGRQRAPRYHNGPNMRPYLRVQNVYEDRIDVSDLNYMDFSPVDFVVFHLRHGDMLLNEGQSFKLVGRPAIYRGEVPGACFQNTLIRFRPYLPLKPEYALLVFRAYMHSGKFQSVAQQTTNIAHLSAGRFAELEFPLAPLSEQKRIVSKVTELLSLCDALEAKLTQAESASTQLLSAAVHHLLTPLAHGEARSCTT